MSHRLLNQASNMLAALPVAYENQSEEWIYPYYRLQEYGFKVDVIKCGEKPMIDKYGIKLPWNIDSKEAWNKHQIYDMIVIPGGWGAEIIRMDENILNIVRYMNENLKTIGAICHGPWVLCSANILKNINATAYIGMKDDITNAGGNYIETGVSTHNHIITASHYKHNPLFMKELFLRHEYAYSK